MEDDDESNSIPSHDSHHSPPFAGVSVAAQPPETLTLALPIQPPYTGGGGGRDDCWSEAATSILIDAWGERYTELSRGNLKQQHWKEVADIVNSSGEFGKAPKTDVQCKNRIDTVKKKFKIEKAKVVGGVGPSRWVFFDRLDRLIGPGPGPDKSVPVGVPIQQPRHFPFPSPSPSQSQSPQFRTPTIRHNFPSPVSQRHPQQPRFSNHVVNHNAQQQLMQQQMFRRGVETGEEVEEEEEGWSNDSGDSLPPETRKRPRKEKGRGRREGKKAVREWGNSVRELTRAILKFGEAYEMAESAKLEHVVEMEKERMKFAKDLELQRMKFLMKTQLELSQFNGDSRDGESSEKGGDVGGGGDGDDGGGDDVGLESNHLD